MDTDAMPRARLLRIPRSDYPESFVLLHVAGPEPSSSSLNLIATEGENPFTGTVRQAHLENLRAKNYHGSDEEWGQIVWHVFGQPAESVGTPGSLHCIESSASIGGYGSAPKELVISIRKRIEGITQRLGSVTLIQNDDQEIQLLDWCGLAIANTNALEQRCRSLRERTCAAENMINQLNDQLQHLIGTKEHHEEQLLANLVRLLNEKKLKIRNQYRMLNTAEPDPSTGPNVQAPSLPDYQAIGQKTTLGKGHSRGARDSGSQRKAESEEVEIDSTAYEESSGDMDQGTEGSITDEAQPAQDGVEKQHSADRETKRLPAHSTSKAQETPSQIDLSNTRLTRSRENAQGNDEASGSAGETDDDEL